MKLRKSRVRVKCELRVAKLRILRVDVRARAEPACDWSAIFRTTCNLPGRERNRAQQEFLYRKQDMHTHTHNTCGCHVRV